MNKLELARIVLDLPELREAELRVYWHPKDMANQWQALIEFIAEHSDMRQWVKAGVYICSENVEELEKLAMELI